MRTALLLFLTVHLALHRLQPGNPTTSYILADDLGSTISVLLVKRQLKTPHLDAGAV